MKRLLTSFIFGAGAAVVIFAGTMAISPPISAAGKFGSESTSDAGAAAAKSDGALFVEFVSVLRHPRCMNCHSRGDFPRQGDDGHPHTMNVRRGPEGHGVTAE